jgi:hypothetical protein
MRMLTSRAITAAAAAAIALSTMTIQPAAAGSRHGMLAAFAAIFGTVAAIIAAEQQRDSYSYSHGPGRCMAARRMGLTGTGSNAAIHTGIIGEATRVSAYACECCVCVRVGRRRPWVAPACFCAAIRTHVDHNR